MPIPILDDTNTAVGSRIGTLRITLTQLRDALLQPGRLNAILTWWHQQAIDATLTRVTATNVTRDQQVTDEMGDDLIYEKSGNYEGSDMSSTEEPAVHLAVFVSGQVQQPQDFTELRFSEKP